MLAVYVLSLADCEARRAPLLKKLRKLGFSPQVVLGIDGRAGLTPEQELLIDRPLATRRARRELTDAEFACALSHQMVYERLLNDQNERALILEDDAILTDSLLPVLKKLAHVDLDLALLDHDLARAWRGSRQQVASGTFAWRVANIPDLATGYLLTESGARKMSEQSFPISYTADWPCDISEWKTYAVMPRPIWQPKSEESSLLHRARALSQKKARWGNPSPPYSKRDFATRLGRLLARRLV